MAISESLLSAYRYHRIAQASRPMTRIATNALFLARHDVTMGKARYPVEHASPCSRQADGMTYIDNPARVGLRLVGRVTADTPRGEIWDSRESTGWYADNDQGASGRLIFGVVYQLPGRDGKARFVAGYGNTDEPGVTLDLSLHRGETTEDMRGVKYGYPSQEADAARTAARWADSMASKAAEEERGYQAAWQAGVRYSELGEEIASSRKAALELLSERRDVKGTAGKPSICGAIRDKVESILDDIRQARQERAKLAEGDFVSEWIPGFWTGDKRLQLAFCEGAGIASFPT